MTCKVIFAVLVVSSVTVVQICGQGQVCIPGAVENIRVTEHSLLVWEPPRNNSCFISYFRVFINHAEGTTTHTTGTGRTSLLINYLEFCESYNFSITPVSPENVLGKEALFFSKMPFPQGVDLSLSYFSVAQRDAGVHLEWQAQNQWKKCAERYRVTVHDQESDSAVDLYVYTDQTTITGLIPCATYTFGVRAFYTLEKEGPYTSTRYSIPASRTSAPVLQRLSQESTSIDMTWQLESYSRNRCPISSLTIDAPPFFRITYPIADQTNRPPFSVHLQGLERDTMYLLNVTVINNAGTSLPALVVIQTLESD